jgi:hypothetical protein
MCLSLKEVTVPADPKVLMEVDDNVLLIVGDHCGILDQQFRQGKLTEGEGSVQLTSSLR